MKEITAYQCDYCTKYYNRKQNAKRHEDICFYNPDTKSCATCHNFEDSLLNEELCGGEYKCRVGIVFDRKESGKVKLRTNCDKWEK